MTDTNKKIPFISGSYYAELLREMKTIGIIFACAQTLVGIIGSFGSGGVNALLTLFSIFLINRNVLVAYFVVAALNFLNAHIKRGAWDLRGSLPIKKRTMFVSHLAATLTWAAVIFAAHYVGVLIGELVRLLPTVHAYGVPAAIFGSAGQMLKSVIFGLIAYGVLITVGSVENRVFSFMIALASIAFIPMEHIGFATEYSGVSNGFMALLFPIGESARAALITALFAAAAVIAVACAYIAFSKARAETWNKPARSAAIHIAIGLGFALLIGFIVMNIGKVTGMEAELALTGEKSSVSPAQSLVFSCIAAALIMTIAYLAYMWISSKSFKKAAARLVYIPIAFAVIGSSLLVGSWMKARNDAIDWKKSNIDHVTLPANAFLNRNVTESYDFDLAWLFFGASADVRGTSGAEKVKFTDPEVLEAASDQLKSMVRDGVNGYSDSIFGNFMNSGLSYMDITLKDGSTWTVRVGEILIEQLAMETAMKNDEYVSRFADLGRFKNGRVFNPDDLGREFRLTLIEELESLSDKERAELFMDENLLNEFGTVQDMYMEFFTSGETIATVTLSSPTYDDCVNVRLTPKLKKSLDAYMKHMNEKTRMKANWLSAVSAMGKCDYNTLAGSITLIENGTVNSSDFNFFPKDEGFEPEYAAHCKTVSGLLAKCIEDSRSAEGAERVMGLKIDYLYSYDSSEFPNGFRDGMIFVGLTREQYDKLYDLFFGSGSMEPEYIEQY